MTSEIVRVTNVSSDTLSRRASLTFFSGILQSAVRFGVGLIVTPLLVRELGAVLYGAWAMMQQAIGWLALTDLRPMGTLKFTLAVEQHLDDVSRKRRQIGAALRLTAFTLPLPLLVGVLATWLAPSALELSGPDVTAVRIALIVTSLSVILDRVLGLPNSVLRGMNLDYKGAYSATIAIAVGALLTIAALRAGFGLPGVAVASLATVLVSSGARFVVARRHVEWLGAERPTREEFRAFTKLSSWLMVGGLGSVLFLSSDLLTVGLVLGPAAAAVYATTGAALRLVAEPLFQLIASSNAGISALCGRQDWARVRAVRTELWLTALGAMTVIGVSVILLNGPFLAVWLGEKYYAGLATTAFLVFLALQTQLLRVDTVMADAMMLMRAKGIITIAAGALGVVCGALGAWRFGLVGMAGGTLIGRTLALVLTPRLLARSIPGSIAFPLSTRPILVSLFLLAAAIVVAGRLPISGWISLIASGAIIVPCVAALWYIAALDASARRTLWGRLTAALPRR